MTLDILCVSGAEAQPRTNEISQTLRRAFTVPEQQWSPKAVAEALSGRGIRATLSAGGCALTQSVLDEAELLTIAVAPTHQRAGLGQRLLAACIEDVRTLGAGSVFLEVAAGNAAALAIYRSAGFIETGRRPRYYRRPDGTRDDALLMRLALG